MHVLSLKLQILYNDVSPMESHHLASAFALLKDPSYDFLEAMPSKARSTFRKQVIEAVLATDMKQHFSLVSLFNTKFLTPVASHTLSGMSRGRSMAGVTSQVGASWLV